MERDVFVVNRVVGLNISIQAQFYLYLHERGKGTNIVESSNMIQSN